MMSNTICEYCGVDFKTPERLKEHDIMSIKKGGKCKEEKEMKA